MKKLFQSIFAGAIISTVSFTAGPAFASCFTNPEICQAICGCSCCTTKTGCSGGTGGFAVKTGRDASAALKQFSTKALKQEMATIKNDAKVKRLLATELKSRNN